MKKCSWFYEFKNIFYKNPGINLPLIIKSRQPLKRDEAAVDENDLKNYDFDFDQNLENFCQIAIYKTEKKEDMDIFYSNLSDLSSDFDSSLYFVLSQIA